MVSYRILIRVLQLQAGHKTQSFLPNGITPSNMLKSQMIIPMNWGRVFEYLQAVGDRQRH